MLGSTSPCSIPEWGTYCKQVISCVNYFFLKWRFMWWNCWKVLDLGMNSKAKVKETNLIWSYILLLYNCSVLSDSLRPHGLQHASLSCPSPSPRAYSNSCPSSQWCHPTISFSVIPFSSCPQSFPASRSFLMSQLFTSGGHYWCFNFSIRPSSEHSGLISVTVSHWIILTHRIMETDSAGRVAKEQLPRKHYMYVCYSLSRVGLFVTLRTVAHQAPLSMGFSRQEYWSGLPFPSPGDLLDPGIEPRSPSLQTDSLPPEPAGKPKIHESESHSVVSDSLQPHDYKVHGILQARNLEWIAFPFSRGSSQPRDQTQVSRIAGGFFTCWTTNAECVFIGNLQSLTKSTKARQRSELWD